MDNKKISINAININAININKGAVMFRKLLRKGCGWIYKSSRIAIDKPKLESTSIINNSPSTSVRPNTHQRILHLLHAGNFPAAKKLQEISSPSPSGRRACPALVAGCPKGG
jgi:hypothetical protein